VFCLIEELERKQKESVVAYFKALSENFYGRTKKNFTENIVDHV
jgi:hypothetical protein